MFKKDLVLNNLQWLICHKTRPKPKSTKILKTKPLTKNFNLNLQKKKNKQIKL